MSNFCACQVFLQPSCSGAWVDISGKAASVAVDGGEFDIGEIKLFGEDHPQVDVGKHARLTLTFRAKYTEAALEPYALIQAAYDNYCDHSMCVRYIPLGDTVGNKVYTTISGILVSPVYPAGDAATPDPTTIEFSITCPRIEISNVV